MGLNDLRFWVCGLYFSPGNAQSRSQRSKITEPFYLEFVQDTEMNSSLYLGGGEKIPESMECEQRDFADTMKLDSQ